MQANKTSPFTPIILKLADKGYTTSMAFDMLDDNMDGCLTKKEIEDGFKHHGIELEEKQMEDFMAAIDADHDGVLDFDEWEAILAPKLDEEGQYLKLMAQDGMGDGLVALTDPLVIQERTLDLMYRSRKMEEELKVMRVTGDNKADEIKRAKKDIKKAEKDFDAKSEASKRANEEAENHLRQKMFE